MSSATIDIYEAKTRLSNLIDRKAAGDDVVIGRGGKPLGRYCEVVRVI